jgi:hypothetical protein
MSEGLSYLSSSAIMTDAHEERVREFPSNDIPPEVDALGTAEAVHQPHPVWATLANCRYLMAGVLLAGGGAILGFCYQQWRHQTDWDLMSLAGLGLVALLCLAGAFVLTSLPSQKATVFLYPRAAVIAASGKLTLIPWRHLLYANGRIWTADGQKFYCGLLDRYDTFEERVWDYSLKYWLPEALAKVQAGGIVTAGPLAVSATHVSYCGKSAKWEEVTEMLVVVGRFYQLNITTKGSKLFHWATINMHEIPNARCMEQLLIRICPEHLLKTK